MGKRFVSLLLALSILVNSSSLEAYANRNSQYGDGYRAFGFAITTNMRVGADGTIKLATGRNLKNLSDNNNKLVGRSITGTYVTDQVSFAPGHKLFEILSVQRFARIRRYPDKTLQNKDSGWLYGPYSKIIPSRGSALEVDVISIDLDNSSAEIEIMFPTHEELKKAFGHETGSFTVYMSFVAITKHDKYDVDTGEWDIDSNVRADLDISENQEARWNYKDFDLGRPARYSVYFNASGSSSARRVDEYEYLLEAGGRHTRERSSRDRTTVSGDIYPDDVSPRERGYFRADGEVTVTDDRNVSDTARDNTNVSYRVINESPSSRITIKDKGTSSETYLYANRPIKIQNFATDPEDQLMDIKYELFKGGGMFGVIELTRDSLTSEWREKSARVNDDYVESYSINGKDLEVTFKKSGEHTIRHSAGDIRGHRIVDQYWGSGTNTIMVRKSPAPPSADFEYILNGKPTTITYPGVPVYFNDKSTDPNDDIVNWQWIKSNGQTQGGKTGAYITYSEQGTFINGLRVEDFLGASSEVAKPIEVIPPIPSPQIKINEAESRLKVNRKIHISGTESFAPPGGDIDWDSSEWTLEALDGQDLSSVKEEGTAKTHKNYLFTQTGRYKITLDLANQFTKDNPDHPKIDLKRTSTIFTIVEDEDPIPAFRVEGNSPNFDSSPTSTNVRVTNTSRSDDGDYLKMPPGANTSNPNMYFGRGVEAYTTELYKDINSDGVFEDTEKIGSFDNDSFNMPIQFRQGEGTNFQARLRVKETFGQETIATLVEDSDRRTAELTQEFSVNWIPGVDFDLPPWTYPGDEITLTPRIKDEDPDSTVTTWEIEKKNPDGTWSVVPWDPETTFGTPGNTGGTGTFNNSGYYRITVITRDNSGQEGRKTKEIRVYPLPTARIQDNPTFRFGPPIGKDSNVVKPFHGKQNRTYHLIGSGTTTDDYGTSIHSIDHSKDYWEIVPMEGQNAGAIKVTGGVNSGVDLSSLEASKFAQKNRHLNNEMLFKEPGKYLVRYQVTNTAGKKSEFAEQIVNILEDRPPKAIFHSYPKIYRPEGGYSLGNAVNITVSSIETDSMDDLDQIGESYVTYKFDSDNDGSFDDESWSGRLSTSTDVNGRIYTTISSNKLGRYLIMLTAKETFGQPTISRFITSSDYKIKESRQIVEVDNVPPTTSVQDVVEKEKVDIVLVDGYDTMYRYKKGIPNSYIKDGFRNSVIPEILKKLPDKDVKISIVSEDTYKTNKSGIPSYEYLSNNFVKKFGNPIVSTVDSYTARVTHNNNNNIGSALIYSPQNEERFIRSSESFAVKFSGSGWNTIRGIIDNFVDDENYSIFLFTMNGNNFIYKTLTGKSLILPYPNRMYRVIVVNGEPRLHSISSTTYNHVFQDNYWYYISASTQSFSIKTDYGSRQYFNPAMDRYGNISIDVHEGFPNAEEYIKNGFARRVERGLEFINSDEYVSDNFNIGGVWSNSGYTDFKLYVNDEKVVRWSNYKTVKSISDQFTREGAKKYVFTSLVNLNQGWQEVSSSDILSHFWKATSADANHFYKPNTIYSSGYYLDKKRLSSEPNIKTQSIIDDLANSNVKQIREWGLIPGLEILSAKNIPFYIRPNSRDFNLLGEAIGEAIKEDLKGGATTSGGTYLLANSTVDYKTQFSDYELDPRSPNEQEWLFEHDESYFDNPTGRIENSGKWVSGTEIGGLRELKHTGRYSIKYRAKDMPTADSRFANYKKWSAMVGGDKIIYVHRQPIAGIDLKTTKEGTKLTIVANSISYDKDHTTRTDKGLVEHEWEYYEKTNPGKKTKVQNETQITIETEVGKEFVIRHRSRDMDGPKGKGVWSNWTTANILNDSFPPIADFDIVPEKYPLDGSLNIIDKSSDPNGDKLIEYRVELKKGSTTLISKTITSNDGVTQDQITQFAKEVDQKIKEQPPANRYGYYKITLQVRDESAPWGHKISTSQIIEKQFEVIKVNRGPKVQLDPTNVYVDGRNELDEENSDNILNNFINWNFSASDPDEDNQGLAIEWELTHRSIDRHELKSTKSPLKGEEITTTNYNSPTPPFVNTSFKNRNLKPGPYEVTVRVTDSPIYGDPITRTLTKAFYVVPEITGTAEIVSANQQLEVNDNFKLTAVTNQYVTKVVAEMGTDTYELTLKSSSGNQKTWEHPLQLTEAMTSVSNVKFIMTTDYGSLDVHGIEGKPTRVRTITKPIETSSIKLIDFKVADIVKATGITFPVSKDNFTVNYTAGYYATLEITAKGNPERVEATVLMNGNPTSTTLNFINTGGETWTAKYYAPITTPINTIIGFNLTAYKGAKTYNYNEKENWNGATLKVVNSLIKDIKVTRTN